MTAFPEPTAPAADRAEVLLRYLAFFRTRLLEKIGSLPQDARAVSTLPSGWTPLELLNHLTHVERRWLEWGFEGADVGDPWADQRDGRWHTDESFDVLAGRAREQAARSDAVVARHALDEIGVPGERWDGAEPASLERVLLHLVQEYARHLGQLDVVVELAGGTQGE
jgi:uncharacterized damage-inducible protein DinB